MAMARATIRNKKGLHARAAAKMVKMAAGYNANVQVLRVAHPGETGEMPSAGATSILSLLMLAAEMGVDIELRADGPQAEQAVTSLKALVERLFDEEE